MKFCHVTTYSGHVLDAHYRRTPALATAAYEVLHAATLGMLHGWSDFLARHVRRAGHEARVIVKNDVRAQSAWERENGRRVGGADTLLRQIERWRPDVVLLEDSFSVTPETVRAIRREGRVRAIVGWVGIMGRTPPILDEIDLLLTCSTVLSRQFADKGIRTATMQHAFEPEILDWVPRVPMDTPISFVGALSSVAHRGRLDLLERIAADAPLAIFSDTLCSSGLHAARACAVSAIRGGLRHEMRLLRTPLRKSALPGVHGVDMFSVLRSSDICLNSHGDAVPMAANMRLFEVTGCGSCLLTDWKPDIDSLFVPDEEVVVYRSADEAAEKALWLIDHPKERAAIAAAGHKRVLREHTYQHRVSDLLDTIEPLL